jgi:hypothetical protein
MELDGKLTFGKYKGLTVREVIEENPGYLVWAISNIEWFNLDSQAHFQLDKALDLHSNYDEYKALGLHSNYDEYEDYSWHEAYDLLA